MILKLRLGCDIRVLAALPGTIILALEVSVHGQQSRQITIQSKKKVGIFR